jgi:fluoroacetyl-CoA thioesterase
MLGAAHRCGTLNGYLMGAGAKAATIAGSRPARRENSDMREIPLGTTGTYTMRVLPEHLANQFKDAMLPQVLATPVMILMMENAALNAIRPYLEAGESAVGTAVNVRHLAATPVGHRVHAEAEVTKIDGKRIEFKVSASDEKETIGSGTHQRMLIDLRSFNERLAAKGKP